MTTVQERPPGANITDPPITRVDLADVNARADWLARLRTQAEDSTAAGLDATAPPGRRMLGRRSARQKILAARRAMRALLAAAEVTT